MAAFASKPGFKPVKHLNGSPYNGQTNVYSVGAAVSLVPGDMVMLVADGTAGGIPQVTIMTAAAVPVGIVMGTVNAKFDPITGKMSNGAISLDTPQVATQNSLVLVADSPDLIMETEIATYAVANINANHEVVPTTYNTTSGASNMKLIYNGGDAADPIRLLGRVLKDDFVTGSGYTSPVDGDTNVKVLVTFNSHQYKGVGIVGV